MNAFRTHRADRPFLPAIIAALFLGFPSVLPHAGAQTRAPVIPPKKDPRQRAPQKLELPDPNAPAATIPDLDLILQRGRIHERLLRVDITIDGFQTPTSHLRSDQQPDIRKLKFDSAAVVFPVINGCASSRTDINAVTGVMSFDDIPADSQPEFRDGYHSGTRLGRWVLRDKEGRQASLALSMPITTWDTVFDEQLALKVPWPKDKTWSPIAISTFERQLWVESDSEAVKKLLEQFTAGKPADTLPPVLFAKYICGKLIETIQPDGSGNVSARNGQFAGLSLRGAERTIIDGRGTDHDMACTLAALYRAGGLPARVVIGHELANGSGSGRNPFRKTGGRGPELYSWVEFCLYDPATKKEIWVPVDPLRIRSFSSRMQPLDKPWKFFGNHDELVDILPFAFTYHPPTTVVAQGVVAFWGWLTVPETQAATQWLRFTDISVSRTAGDPAPGERPLTPPRK